MSRSWTRPCCVRGESTTSFAWEKRVITRRWSCTAGSFPTRRKWKHGNLLRLRGWQKRWLNFKACSWLWNKEKDAWIFWQNATESGRRVCGGEDESYFTTPGVAKSKD